MVLASITTFLELPPASFHFNSDPQNYDEEDQMDSCLAAQEGNVNDYLSTKEFRFPLRFPVKQLPEKLIILVSNLK